MLALINLRNKRKVLNVPYKYQIMSKWCTEATAQMAVLWYGGPEREVLQCQLATVTNQMPSCCDAPEYCNEGAVPIDQQKTLVWATKLSWVQSSYIRFDDIIHLINKKLPLIANLRLPNGNKHVILINGYDIKDEAKSVVIHDPHIKPNIIFPFNSLPICEVFYPNLHDPTTYTRLINRGLLPSPSFS